MAYPRIDELTANIKTLQPKPAELDEGVYNLLINLAVTKVVNDVAAFTNTPAEDLPEELESSMLMKLSAWFTDTGAFLPASERTSGTVSSITEGDTSVSYATPQGLITAMSGTSFLDDDFKATLMRYRKVRWW